MEQLLMNAVGNSTVPHVSLTIPSVHCFGRFFVRPDIGVSFRVSHETAVYLDEGFPLGVASSRVTRPTVDGALVLCCWQSMPIDFQFVDNQIGKSLPLH